MNRKTLVWLGLGLAAVIALAALGLLLYAPKRPHLTEPNRMARQAQINQFLLSPQSYSREKADVRPAIGAWREFLLDYPETKDPALQLKLAEYATGGESPDFEFVADQVEQAILTILARYGPDKDPTVKELVASGLPDEKQYRDWTAILFVEDVDGDGRKDVVVSAPGYWGETVCCLFRHTAQGWKAHRLVVGAHIMGIWVYDVTESGPKVIQIASLADSPYRPNLFVDVFAWQKGRINSVLAGKIPNGFQLEHKDIDGNGVQAIRFYGNAVKPNEYEWPYKSHLQQTFRWDGEKFTLAQTASTGEKGAAWLEEGKRLFEAGKFAEAVSTLKSGLAIPRKGSTDYYYEFKQEPGWYYLGMSYAFLGQFNEALAAMNNVQAPSGSEAVWHVNAEKFRSACQHPGDLSVALASIGQGFRVIEQTGRRASPDAGPKQVIDAAGLPLDSWQELQLNGQPAGVARVHWFGGSAVVALRRDPVTREWSVWPVAYGLENPLPKSNWYPESQEIFYLPRPPVIQLYPAPTDVALGAVTSGSAPQITVRYQQNHAAKESSVQWNGERFAPVGPQSAAKEDFSAELNRLEAALFRQNEYASTLDELAAFESRIRSSGLSEKDKSALLLEVFYHQALCYRKSGQSDRAAVTYAALSRTDSQNAWTGMAKQWVRFDTGHQP